MTVPEYVVSCSTAKVTPAIEVGEPEADVALVVLETLVPLDEEVLLELAGLVAELKELDRFEALLEAELLTELDELTVVEELAGSLTFWYMFRPEGPPQIWLELPAQTILHRPSEVDTDPAWIALPQ